MVLNFTDGESFDTSGELRVIHRKDGWYVTGKGMLLPVRDEAEGNETIRRIKMEAQERRIAMPELGTVTDIGDLQCPRCKIYIVTPEGMNPHNGNHEKMTLTPGGLYVCNCGIAFTVTPEEARKHNHYWFPHDPKYKPEYTIPSDVDCITQPDGSCIAQECRLHGPKKKE